jgi:hypothetical protein
VVERWDQSAERNGTLRAWQREAMSEDECPVCFGALRTDPSRMRVDNSMACPSGHRVCTKCVRKLVQPHPDVCCGMYYRCPICRADGALSQFHTLILLKGSLTRARAMFEDEEEAREWLGPHAKRARAEPQSQCAVGGVYKNKTG